MPGPSGEIKYQDYIQKTHANMMFGANDDAIGTTLDLFITNLHNMADILTDADEGLLSLNPYTSVVSYNPDTDLSQAQSTVNSFSALVSEIDEISTWNTMVDAAFDKLSKLLPDTSQVDSEVTSYEAAAKTQLANSYNRVAAGFFDINGVVGTAFPSALAMLELSFTTDVNRFRAERTHQADKNRAMVMAQAVDSMTRLLQTKLQGSANTVNMQGRQAGMTIAAKEDQRIADTNLSVDETFWRMRALRSGLDVLKGPAGVAAGPEGPSKFDRIMSGVLTSFSMAGQLGQITGSVEAGVGAFVLGSLASVFAANQ